MHVCVFVVSVLGCYCIRFACADFISKFSQRSYADMQLHLKEDDEQGGNKGASDHQSEKQQRMFLMALNAEQNEAQKDSMDINMGMGDGDNKDKNAC